MCGRRRSLWHSRRQTATHGFSALCGSVAAFVATGKIETNLTIRKKSGPFGPQVLQIKVRVYWRLPLSSLALLSFLFIARPLALENSVIDSLVSLLASTLAN